MASIRIIINTDGTAFLDPDGRQSPTIERPVEVARILRVMAAAYERTGSLPLPEDANGSIVGTAEVLD